MQSEWRGLAQHYRDYRDCLTTVSARQPLSLGRTDCNHRDAGSRTDHVFSASGLDNR